MRTTFALVIFISISLSIFPQNNSDVYNIIYSDNDYIAFDKNGSFLCLKNNIGSMNWNEYKTKLSIYDNNEYEFSKLIKIENDILIFGDGDYGQIKNIIIYDLKNKKYITKDEYYGTIREVTAQGILFKEINNIKLVKDTNLIDKKSVENATLEVKNSNGNLFLQYYYLFQFDIKTKMIRNIWKIIGKAIP